MYKLTDPEEVPTTTTPEEDIWDNHLGDNVSF
jgi:hypothetical protein